MGLQYQCHVHNQIAINFKKVYMAILRSLRCQLSQSVLKVTGMGAGVPLLPLEFIERK